MGILFLTPIKMIFKKFFKMKIWNIKYKQSAYNNIPSIKVNLKAALDYIENPDKTDDKMLVSSFGCSYETADIEFQMLLDQAFKKGNNPLGADESLGITNGKA